MLRLHGVTVRFGDVVALDGIDLTLEEGETLALLGRSGSGKTTVLHAIAGLVPLDSGSITLDGADLAGTPTHERHIGLVFQDFALFPHLDVAGNVGYGLAADGHRDIAARVGAALQQVRLDGLQTRRVDQLSGGQAQRVALARTLATRPSILLLDEPLGSLDPAYRKQVGDELAELLGHTEIPTIIVTHDTAEAFSLGDRVVVLDRGRIAGTGTPAEIWNRPGSAEVARIVGHTGIVTAEVRSGVAHVDGIEFPAPPGAADGPATLLIRSDGIRAGGGSVVTVVSSRYRGPDWATGVALGDAVVEVTTATGWAPGETLEVSIDPSGVALLS